MNARSMIDAVMQIGRVAGGDPSAIATLATEAYTVISGGISRLRAARTNTERGAAIDDLIPALERLGIPATAEEIATDVADIEGADSKFDRKFDFTPGGPK